MRSTRRTRPAVTSPTVTAAAVTPSRRTAPAPLAYPRPASPAPAASCGCTPPALVTYSRRHIDLQRVATALCPGLANGRSGA
ncbi:putative leader peptide [Streptomyces sp. NPDC004031]